MAKQQSVRLLLVRSGATDWVDSTRIQGATDLPLSAQGRAATLEALQNVEIPALAAILAPSDEACSATASMISERAGARVKTVRGLHEVELGLWEGLLTKDVLDRYPKAFGQWRQDPSGIAPPDGETIADAESRIFAALGKTIEKTGPGPIGVVLRPIAWAIVRRRLMDDPPANVWDVYAEQAGAEWIDTTRSRLKAARQEARSGV